MTTRGRSLAGDPVFLPVTIPDHANAWAVFSSLGRKGKKGPRMTVGFRVSGVTAVFPKSVQLRCSWTF